MTRNWCNERARVSACAERKLIHSDFRNYIADMVDLGKSSFEDLEDREINDLLSSLIQSEEGANTIDFITDSEDNRQVGLMFAACLRAGSKYMLARNADLVAQLKQCAVEKYREIIDEALYRERECRINNETEYDG